MKAVNIWYLQKKKKTLQVCAYDWILLWSFMPIVGENSILFIILDGHFQWSPWSTSVFVRRPQVMLRESRWHSLHQGMKWSRRLCLLWTLNNFNWIHSSMESSLRWTKVVSVNTEALLFYAEYFLNWASI